MQISFTHCNPKASHDSTLLTIEFDETTNHYLIDAGHSVTPGAFLGEQGLDGIFLTHAHRDHYASIDSAVDGDTPIYASPATASIFGAVYDEAGQSGQFDKPDEIDEALTPIDGWTPLNDRIEVLPLPAGHTPGAAGFFFRVDDLEANGETVTILATGDFTTHPVAGSPPLQVPEAFDVDVLIANAATSADFQDSLRTAIETSLERALSGATTVIASSALTGVHTAYLLGHTLAELDRQVTVNIVGQAAKHYDALGYDVPFVRSHPHFEHTDEVLQEGAITIAGPQSPTQGSTSRLLGVVEDDPTAVFIQLATGSPEPVEASSCATHYFDLSPHPTEVELMEFISENLPRHLVLKHLDLDDADAFKNEFDAMFYWANDDSNKQLLYDDGAWAAPPWISEANATRIRQRNYQESSQRIPLDQPLDERDAPNWERGQPALQAEGIDVDALAAAFPAVSEPHRREATAESDGGPKATADAGPPANGQAASTPDVTDEVLDRLDDIEATLEDLQETPRVTPEELPDVGPVTDRLDDLESRVDRLPAELADDAPSVSASVVRQNDLVLFRVPAGQLDKLDADLTHQDTVELELVSTPDSNDSDSD